MLFPDLKPPPEDVYLSSTVHDMSSSNSVSNDMLHNNSSPAFNFDWAQVSPKKEKYRRSSSLPRDGSDIKATMMSSWHSSSKSPSPPLTAEPKQAKEETTTAAAPTRAETTKLDVSSTTSNSTTTPAQSPLNLLTGRDCTTRNTTVHGKESQVLRLPPVTASGSLDDIDAKAMEDAIVNTTDTAAAPAGGNNDKDEDLTCYKYVQDPESGIRHLNPAWAESQTTELYPFANRATALPVVSFASQANLFAASASFAVRKIIARNVVTSLLLDSNAESLPITDDYEYDNNDDNTASAAPAAEDIQPESEMVESYEQAMQEYQQQCFWQALQDYEDIGDAFSSQEFIELDTKKKAANDDDDALHQAARTHSDGMKHQLLQVLARYEIPAGMLSKLMGLHDFDRGEILVDDSSEMARPSDVAKKPPFAGFLTRWAEAKERILQMMELVAYLPSAPPYYVRFLNRSSQVELKRLDSEQPAAFLNRITASLSNEFAKPPMGGAPALERIRESFRMYRGRAVLRYFLSHGVPDGGVEACASIVNLLMSRAQPDRNPFTFLSCTDQDENTVWMKECEEAAPYCSEFDDYMDESAEVLKDQGKAFPYSYGLYLVGQLVAAFNPDDLDCMDESVPLALQTLADLLGYRPLPSEYKYYFDSFIEAQRKLPLEDYRQDFVAKLPKLYDDFREVSVASDIVHVRNYRRRVKACNPTKAHAAGAATTIASGSVNSSSAGLLGDSSSHLSPPQSPARRERPIMRFFRQLSKRSLKKESSA